LAEEVTRIAEKTQFNTRTLLAGGLKDDGAVTIQIGANKGETLSIEIGTMTAAKLSVSGLVVSTSAWAQSAISKIDAAINTVSTERARLGAKQNRLEHTIKNLGHSSRKPAGV